jgi:hypothetical protein
VRDRTSMFPREKLIAVISSGDLHFRNGEGYALVITDGRIVGATRGAGPGVPGPYLWSAEGSSEEERLAAESVAADIIRRKRFNLSKGSIFKILYDAPGMFFGGRIVFGVVGEEVQLDLSSVSAWTSGGVATERKLLDALLAFAPDRLYDEKTGALINREAVRL